MVKVLLDVDCPRCARLDGRNSERYSLWIQDLLSGLRLHCSICGRQVDALAMLPAEQAIIAKRGD